MFREKDKNDIVLIDFGGSDKEKSLIKIYSPETDLES